MLNSEFPALVSLLTRLSLDDHVKRTLHTLEFFTTYM